MQYASGILLVPGWAGTTPYIVPWHNVSESHYPPHSGKLVGEAGQYAVIPDMPVCGYTVAETVDTGKFSTSYNVYVSETGESASTTVNSTGAINASGTGISVSRTFSAGKTDAIVFTNAYRYATLTIRSSEAEADQVFVYKVQKIVDNNPTGKCITVTVTGNSSTTIHGLIPGTYTVTQKNNWSWRYGDADAVQTVSLPAGDTDVTFINSVANDSWNVTLDNGKIKHAPQIRKVICCATHLHTNKICMSVC